MSKSSSSGDEEDAEEEGGGGGSDDSESDEPGSSEDEDLMEGEEDVEITLPENQYDIDEQDEEAENRKQQKRAVWSDPSDELIGLDLNEIKRLRKLARGKKSSKVGGFELERRLREQ